MSETNTDPVIPEVAPVPVPVVDVSSSSTPDAPPEQVAAPETPPEPEPKPRRADRHVANLTARLAAKEAELAAAERAREAAEALVRAGRTETPETQPTAPVRGLDVETRANQIAAEREFNRRLADIDAAGKKELGDAAWMEAKSLMTGLGATGNQAFLEALAETSNPSRVFAALAEDSDELTAILAKSPAAMAAHLGRLDAKMEQPKPPAISRAPTPPAPIRTPAVEPEPDIYDDKLSMKEWAALWDKRAPKHLGGRA